MPNLDTKKLYLGDAVSVQFDGWNVILTTDNGVEVTNEIFLEPPVLQSLLDYIKRLRPVDDPAAYKEGDVPQT